jgi:hypothetical protein
MLITDFGHETGRGVVSRRPLRGRRRPVVKSPAALIVATAAGGWTSLKVVQKDADPRARQLVEQGRNASAMGLQRG